MMDDKDTSLDPNGADTPAASDKPETEGGETPWAAAPEAAPQPDLASEHAQMKDQLLRTLAEMENLRRRTEREVKDAGTYAIANFARDMLNVGDNMRRALDAIPADLANGGEDAFKALHEGIEMTERELLRALEKHGIRKLDPLDQRFDPNFHQAMFEVDNPHIPAGTVVQVMQSGYVIGERVLRPALVGVSKGGAKPAKPQEAALDAQAKGEQPSPDQAGEADDAAHSARAARAAADAMHSGSGEERKGAKVDKSA